MSDAAVREREQIAWGIMGRMGEDTFEHLETRGHHINAEVAPTLCFEAKLLPFRRSDGQRAKGRVWMQVQVMAIPNEDYFDAYVFYYFGGTYRGHCKANDIHEDVLGRFLKSLDYDGPEILNPAI